MEHAKIYPISSIGIKEAMAQIFYKVKNAKPLEKYKLLVSFENGEQKQYNVLPLIKNGKRLSLLRTRENYFIRCALIQAAME